MKFFLDECLPLSLTKLIEELGFQAEHALKAYTLTNELRKLSTPKFLYYHEFKKLLKF